MQPLIPTSRLTDFTLLPLQIVESLVREESVFPLPGKCFNIPDYFRVVLTVPGDLMAEACKRIAEFCDRHSVYDLASRSEVQVQPTFRLQSHHFAAR